MSGTGGLEGPWAKPRYDLYDCLATRWYTDNQLDRDDMGPRCDKKV